MAKTSVDNQVLTDLKFGRADDTIVLFVPSKDKKGKAVSDQAQWASAAATLFANLFGGSTGFKELIGSWFDPEAKNVLSEQPIMIQSLTKRSKIENAANLRQLLAFCKRMGKKSNQACVGLAINDVFYYIDDYSEA